MVSYVYLFGSIVLEKITLNFVIRYHLHDTLINPKLSIIVPLFLARFLNGIISDGDVRGLPLE